jgi:hypothetical protein
MPNRSIRDEMQFGAPLGPEAHVAGAKRPQVSQGTQQQAAKAISDDIAASKRPVASKPAPSTSSTNPTADLRVTTAADRIAGRPAAIDAAVDQATE